MMKILSLALALLVSAFTIGCAPIGSGNSAPTAEIAAEPTVAPAQYNKITAEEAKERMDSGREVTIVDVRTQAEYDGGHIPGAILIPNESIGSEMPAELPDLGAEILLYCRSGRRSREAAEKMVAMGYTAVYDFGGIIDWPYDVVTD